MNRIARAVLILLALPLLLLTAEGTPEETGPVKIGMYGDLSTGTAQWGTDAEKGGRLRVKEANAAGGVLGRPIELIVYDCKVSPTEAVKVYTRLAQQDTVAAVCRSLISNTALAVSPLAA